jgi:ABC-2 type transport system ATP-binding protein
MCTPPAYRTAAGAASLSQRLRPRRRFGRIDATIRTEGLSKVYAGVPGSAPGPVEPLLAVDGLDLEVRRGELFGLLGPNGAGKTTTIGMLTTRVVPTSGAAYVDGIDVMAEPARTKERIGVVTQTNTLDRSLDVRENLEFHGRYFGLSGRAARAEAERVLEVMRLTDKAGADVATLSGGMAQRLMVGRAILHRPEVLFLDEPTAGLDPQSRIGLWEIVRELHREGQTVLLTTHYMEEADQLCERVAIMDGGRILALDSPASLKRTVGADTVVAVQADGDPDALATTLRGLEAATDVLVADGVVRVYVAGADGVLPRVIGAAERAGHLVRDVHVTEPSLETVFITLTGKELRE